VLFVAYCNWTVANERRQVSFFFEQSPELVKHCHAILTYSYGKGRLAAMTQFLDGAGHGSDLSTSNNDEIVGVYNRTFRKLLGYCTYRLYGKDVAEDAVSAVFLRMVQEWATLRGRDETQLRNWLYGTASNVVAGLLKDSKRHSDALAAYDQHRQAVSGGEGLDDARYPDWPVVHAAILTLPMLYQELIVLRYLQGMDVAAIAGATGLKAVTVRVRLSRAVKRLRKALGGSHQGWNGVCS
jgi:RNA polymerase sigma-70 factor (ECF subfamily)